MIFNVEVKNRIITLNSVIEEENGTSAQGVGGNKGDKVYFTLDAEWLELFGTTELKAAFIWKGKYYMSLLKADEEGQIYCDAPIIYNSNNFYLGIYAGEDADEPTYKSTTRVEIPCKLSIRDYTNSPHDDYGGNYTDLAKEAADRAEEAAKKAELYGGTTSEEAAERAEASALEAQKSVKEVRSLVVENSEATAQLAAQTAARTAAQTATAKAEEVIAQRLAELGTIVQTTGDSVTAVMSQKAVSNVFDTMRRDVVVDVEPYVIKNFWISYGSTTGQSVTWANTIEVPCKAGEIYKLNMNGTQIYDGNPCFIRNANKTGMLLIMGNYASVPDGDKVFTIPEGGASIVITFSPTKTPIPSLRRCELPTKDIVHEEAKEACAESMVGASNALTGKAVGSAIILHDVSPTRHKIKVKATYPNGVDPTAIVATACGKNLIPFPYPRQSSGNTQGGVTITVQEDGGICFNGTSTETTWWGLCTINFGTDDIISTSNGHFISSAEYSTADLKAGKTPRWKVAYDKNNKSTFIELKAGTYENMVAYPQIEVGRVSTEYARGDVNIALAFDENGEAEVDSIHPDMTVYSFQDGVSFSVDYTKDINIALAKTQYKGYGLPTLYFYGDTDKMTKDVKVTLDYRYGDRSGTCTMKWQGSSSIAYEKKNYTVTFDTKFEAVEGWGEQKKYCLKANFIDHSHLRNICSAKLWGSMVKMRSNIHQTLAASPNYGAVDGFPVCVVINDVYAGLYTFSVPKDGWMMGMGSGSQEAIVSAESGTYDACRFKGTSNILTAFDVEYATDEDNTAWIETSLKQLIQACINSDGTDIDTTIAQYLDLDSAIDYLIFSLATDNHDGIFRNYLLSTYDGVKWFFTAYDLDSVYGNLASGTGVRRVTESYPDVFKSNHRLFELLLTYKFDAVKARFAALSGTTKPLEDDEIAYQFSNYSAKIPKALLDEDCKIWKTIPGTTYNNLGQIIDWYRRRFVYLKQWLG